MPTRQRILITSLLPPYQGYDDRATIENFLTYAKSVIGEEASTLVNEGGGLGRWLCAIAPDIEALLRPGIDPTAVYLDEVDPPVFELPV